MPKDFDIVMFDLDGNIIDTTTHFLHEFDIAKKEYNIPSDLTPAEIFFMIYDINRETNGMFGLPKSIRKISKNMNLGFKKGLRFMVNAFIGYRKYRRKPNLIEDIEKVLSELKNKGYTVCVVSSGSKSDIKSSTKELKRFIDFIVSKDDVENVKPHPEMVNVIAKKFKVKPEKILFVGDMDEDLEAAKNAGAKSVLFTRTNKLLGTKNRIKPDYKIEKMKDLLDLV